MMHFQTIRNIHLWLGLVLTIFLLAEAVTGLLLSEPALTGAGRSVHTQHLQAAGEQKSSGMPNQNFTEEQARKAEEHAQAVAGDVSTLMFIKELHQGIINSRNFRWVVDIVAVGIIILTVTGIYLSIPLLKAQFKSKV